MFRRALRLLPAVLVAAMLVAAPLAYSHVREKNLRNFRVVDDGVLYRSAQLTPSGLERIVHDYGIRYVLNFRDVEDGKWATPPDPWEEEVCFRLGIKYQRMPLRVWSEDHGTVPAEENVKKFLEIMADPNNRPVLVHCFRGVHRTGSYCAIYRMEYQGWSNKEALDELKALGYDKLDQEDDVRGYLERYVPHRK